MNKKVWKEQGTSKSYNESKTVQYTINAGEEEKPSISLNDNDRSFTFKIIDAPKDEDIKAGDVVTIPEEAIIENDLSLDLSQSVDIQVEEI
jgi:uncharacterized Zn finger protein